jgi:hypothetical protein
VHRDLLAAAVRLIAGCLMGQERHTRRHLRRVYSSEVGHRRTRSLNLVASWVVSKTTLSVVVKLRWNFVKLSLSLM